jgi:hypothetical protein
LDPDHLTDPYLISRLESWEMALVSRLETRKEAGVARNRGCLVRLFGLVALLGMLAQSGCTFWNQPPATPAAPTGPATGDLGTAYSFSAVTTDPEGKTISYEFDWDDGSAFGTTGFVASGATGTLSHTYAAAGTYHILVRAIEEGGAASGWSPEHAIVIGGGGGTGGEGDILWQVEVTGFGSQPFAYVHPAIGPDGTIYVTATGGTATSTSRLIALRPDGTEKWRVDSTCGWMGHPQVAADGTIYVTTCGKKVTAYTPSGTKNWEYDAGQTIGGIAVDALGNVYGFHSDTATTERKVFSLTPAGAERWRVDLDSGGYHYVGQALVVGTGGRVYVSAYYGGGIPSLLFALNASAGAKVWEVALNNTVNAGAMAAGGHGEVYVPLGYSTPYRVVAVTASGSILWDQSLSGPPGGPSIGTDGTVYTVVQGQGLVALDPLTGATLWTAGEAPAFRGNAVAANGVVYFTGGVVNPAPFIAANDDGTIRWRANVPCAVGSPAIASDGTVIVTGGATVSALRGGAALASSVWPRTLNGNRNTGSADE